jgi:fumarate reductase subunit D
VVTVPILWHAAHRLRITAHDLGIYADGLVMFICYGIAALGTIVTFVALLGL